MRAGRHGLQIRAAAITDATELCALFAAAGHGVSGGAMTARLDALARSACASALVAVEWGPPSGVVTLSWAPRLCADSTVARLDLLLVAPDDRRRGIGRLLLKAASQAARSAGCGTLLVDVPVAGSGKDEACASLAGFCLATGFDRTGSLFARPLRKKG